MDKKKAKTKISDNPWEAEEPTQPDLQANAPAPPSAAPSAPPPEFAVADAANSKKLPELGPIRALFDDPDITEILVNGLKNVLVEKSGLLYMTPIQFANAAELNRVVRNILDRSGKFLSVDHPYVDGTLPDGSRYHLIGPPITLEAPYLSIRRFSESRFTLDQLVDIDTLSKSMSIFLKKCIKARINILVSGGTSSGKTTVLNSFLNLISPSERVITIEDTPELLLHQSSGVRLYTKLQTPTSAAVTARELIANSLRMRPDRIIVGECRRQEAMDMLQAMNTGHAGSMTTVHANSVRDALYRLESLCLLDSETQYPLLGVRRLLVNALDLVIQVKRLRSGARKIVHIAEVTGLESDVVTLQDIYIYHEDSEGNAGEFRPTGMVPSFVEDLEKQGIFFDRALFSR